MTSSIWAAVIFWSTMTAMSCITAGKRGSGRNRLYCSSGRPTSVDQLRQVQAQTTRRARRCRSWRTHRDVPRPATRQSAVDRTASSCPSCRRCARRDIGQPARMEARVRAATKLDAIAWRRHTHARQDSLGGALDVEEVDLLALCPRRGRCDTARWPGSGLAARRAARRPAPGRHGRSRRAPRLGRVSRRLRPSVSSMPGKAVVRRILHLCSHRVGQAQGLDARAEQAACTRSSGRVDWRAGYWPGSSLPWLSALVSG